MYIVVLQSFSPQFYIQLIFKPHFGTWVLLFGQFWHLRQYEKKKWIWVFLSNFVGVFSTFCGQKNWTLYTWLFSFVSFREVRKSRSHWPIYSILWRVRRGKIVTSTTNNAMGSKKFRNRIANLEATPSSTKYFKRSYRISNNSGL